MCLVSAAQTLKPHSDRMNVHADQLWNCERPQGGAAGLRIIMSELFSSIKVIEYKSNPVIFVQTSMINTADRNC